MPIEKNSAHSQTMRIDIPPELKEELRLGKRLSAIPLRGPPPEIPESVKRKSMPVGDADFQQLFQSVYDGAVIAELDGRIRGANSRACEFLQQSDPELRMLSISDLISGADATTVEDLRASLEKNRFVLIQAHCIRNDGSLFPAEIAVNRLTVRGHQYLCLFIRDVSQRRKAEALLRAVHNAVQNSSTGIAIADTSGKISYLNLAAAKLWGFDRTRDLMGRLIQDLLPDPAQGKALVEIVLKGGNYTDEIVLSNPNGAPVHVRVMAAGNKDEDGQPVGLVLSFLDISDRKRADEAERRAERQRVMVESLGTACHHLGQPATILLTSLELMNRRGGDRATHQELLQSSMEAAESLRKMLHELNDITEYRTTSYMSEQGEESGSEARILMVNPKE